MLTVSKAARSVWLMPLAACELRIVCAAMLDAAGASGTGRAGVCVDLALLDDAGMEALHVKHFGCPGPTNILAFPDPTRRSLGHLALSVDTLDRECFLYGQEPQEHCVRLLAHGLAHLLGHDHGPAMSALAERMERAGLHLP